MKRVLILSYYFPPLGMGGTQRIAAFARHLPQFGWQPTIVTVKNVRYFAYDNQLEQDVAHLDIQRTASLDPLRLTAIFQKKAKPARPANKVGAWRKVLNFLNFVLIPDNKILWLPFLWLRARKLLRQFDYAMILSSGPPHSTHLLAKRLAKMTKTPWVADFRDGWAGGNFQGNFTRFHQKLDRLLQKKVVTAANHTIAVSNGLAGSLQNTSPRARISVITNGYEPDDFAADSEPDEHFDLVHIGATGNFVDPASVLKAVQVFIQKTKPDTTKIRLHFIGADIDGDLLQKVAAAELSDIVSVTGYLPHDEAVKYYRRADALLFIVTGEPDRGFIPGKTFEYLAARKPTLAVSPEIEGLEILKKNGELFHALPGENQAVQLHLETLYENFQTRKKPNIEPENLNSFSRRELTKELATIFDKCILHPRCHSFRNLP